MDSHDDASSAGADGEKKPDGLGPDGTIPDDPAGVAAGYTGVQSNFEPEEDEQADQRLRAEDGREGEESE